MNAAPLKNFVKQTLRNVAPQAFGALMSRRANRHARRVLERDGIPALAERFVAAHGASVADGPFRGMQYVDASVGSVLIPKLVGCYELELQPAIERALAQPYDVVVDVGCAEGYYSVGLARRLPRGTVVHAFDTDPDARAGCSELALLNGVADRVVVGGLCDVRLLQQTLRGRSRVFCDCEGYEIELLDPLLVPRLRNADLIVELHDLQHPGLTAALTARFVASHHIELIDAVGRDPAAYPMLDVLPQPQRARAVSEYRGGPQQWAVMTANGRGAG